MNVLVYAGSEVDPKSLDNTLTLLSSISLPNYTVQPVSKASFLKEPWEVGCRLFVLPYLKPGRFGSRGNVESSSLDIFGPTEVKRLRKFVEQEGGSMLGVGLGARLEPSSGSSLERAMANLSYGYGSSVSNIKSEDLRESLKFQDKSSSVLIYPETHESSSEGSMAPGGPKLNITDAKIAYIEPQGDSPEDSTLCVSRSVGKGKVAFIRPTLITSLDQIPDSLAPFLHSTLTDIGLHLPNAVAASSDATVLPLPQFFTSIPFATDESPKPIVSTIIRDLFPSSVGASGSVIGTIIDTADTFTFLPWNQDKATELLNTSRTTEASKYKSDDGKVVILCPDGVPPPKSLTPKFDISLYYDALRKLKTLEHSDLRPDSAQEGEKGGWDIGDALLYGERVTSTQSLFDRNPQLLTSLPTPILSLASQQISGRGRGKNVWLSPDGCLMFSLLLRIELDTGAPRPSGSIAHLRGGSKTTSKTSPSGTKPTKTTQSSSDASDTASLKTSGANKTYAQLKSSDASSSDPQTLKSSSTGLKTVDGSNPVSELKSASTGLKLVGSSSETVPKVTPLPKIIPSTLPRLPASRLVFVQYLFALAVAEACRLPEVLGPELGKRVRLKWPNDIYLDTSEEGVGAQPKDWSQLKKIGGVLVNTNFGPGGRIELVIGCGLNVLNEPPIASLAQLKRQLTGKDDAGELGMERTAAAIMTVFSRMWVGFVHDHGSFGAFESVYLDTWLHQDQRVTLTTVSPPQPVRIVGITPDYGLLRTVADRAGISAGGVGSVGLGKDIQILPSYPRYVYPGGDKKEFIDLQPDGNSFDLMAGLIKAKTN